MPYSHRTLQTNMGVPLSVGHDFEYVYIDHDPIQGTSGQMRSRSFAEKVFRKRARASGPPYHSLKLRDLVGKSVLLNHGERSWESDKSLIKALEHYGSEDTILRAKRLVDRPLKFRDEIARKLGGALVLRQAVEKTKGRGELDVYSGDSIVIRCSDGNPRRLIRLFNALLSRGQALEKHAHDVLTVPILSAKEQTRTLISFGASTLYRVQSEPQVGLELYSLLEAVGLYMQHAFYERALTTDQVSSIKVDQITPRDQWTLVKSAVALGLLFPNVNNSNPDHMPEREGTFRLAYVLAPHFRLLPRRGKARALQTILLHSRRSNQTTKGRRTMEDIVQQSLFSNDSDPESQE